MEASWKKKCLMIWSVPLQNKGFTISFKWFAKFHISVVPLFFSFDEAHKMSTFLLSTLKKHTHIK